MTEDKAHAKTVARGRLSRVRAEFQGAYEDGFAAGFEAHRAEQGEGESGQESAAGTDVGCTSHHPSPITRQQADLTSAWLVGYRKGFDAARERFEKTEELHQSEALTAAGAEAPEHPDTSADLTVAWQDGYAAGKATAGHPDREHPDTKRLCRLVGRLRSLEDMDDKFIVDIIKDWAKPGHYLDRIQEQVEEHPDTARLRHRQEFAEDLERCYRLTLGEIEPVIRISVADLKALAAAPPAWEGQ